MKQLTILLLTAVVFSACNPFTKEKPEKPEKINVFFFTFKDEPDTLKAGTTYYMNVKSSYYSAKETMVSVNNGEIVNSEVADWAFQLTPEKAGRVRISVHFKKRKTGEMSSESVYFTVVE